jgi:hypothetical protein
MTLWTLCAESSTMHLGTSLRVCFGLCLIAALLTTTVATASAAPALRFQVGQEASGTTGTNEQIGAGVNTPAPQSTSQQAPSLHQPPSSSTTQTPPVVAPVQEAQPLPAPIGTAAAPDTTPRGVSASTPAGAAIAPAKQKRVSRISIRTALVIGAVVAVGIVAGASLASPSRAQ